MEGVHSGALGGMYRVEYIPWEGVLRREAAQGKSFFVWGVGMVALRSRQKGVARAFLSAFAITKRLSILALSPLAELLPFSGTQP